MFSSFLPLHYDQRWHLLQPPDHLLQGYCGSQNHQLQPPPPPPPPLLSQVGGGSSPVKAKSMADKARLAKLPQPEAGLKCPRCESMDTKFCYFNNYNLSQPRYFCKTCRRYWTRGGAVRNIPVGGACRKNKRSKSKRSSKSHHQVIVTSSATASTPSGCSTETTNYFPTLSPHLQMPFMDDIQTCGGGNMGVVGFQPKIAAEGGGGEACFGWLQSGSSNFLSVGGAEQWRLPLLTGLEAPVNFFDYSHEPVDQERSGVSTSQLAPVKMEESQLRLDLSRQFMGVCENNDQFWGGIQWREISGLNSSSPSNLL